METFILNLKAMAIQNFLFYIFIVLALPRQSIAVSPSVTAWSGENVTISCSCQVEPDKKPVMIWVKHHEAHGDVHDEKPEIIAHDDQILIDQDEEKFTAVVKRRKNKYKSTLTVSKFSTIRCPKTKPNGPIDMIVCNNTNLLTATLMPPNLDRDAIASKNIAINF